ncbi:serine/threonine protein kinase [Streptomyces anulatus]|uniref:serine/threonine-protein kinase n=1 Tax=Streptomyces TaxID=1883 RepID=UPI00067A86D5|nr:MULTISPECIES: serine/threonine-protein kinase [Streptomyces]KND37955.1 protein kinase [Streptomyces europaeiscabiei]KPL32027.1 protein kinase [Streptomyces anulatus]WSC63584.1 serine/threonine protein kinase [Streptomyces anulatus]WSR77956.1 serine/threonine protein kinase [Streptomyces anulatus]WTC73298.1 serine/threonine protein kinase [Streptomyces anulatus]
MTDHGGRANEPTSYGIQPPRPPGGFGAPHSAPYPAPPAHIPPPTVHASAPDSAVNRLVGGRYRLLARLGHGGMGTVWRAHDEVVDREVAVKEPRVPEHLGEREHSTVHQRMQREARAAARIDHPSVVTVHDVVVEDGKPWIVMELVRGPSLGDRLQEGTLDPREAARIGLAVLDALTAAHAIGILHRDVKPDNVMLGTGDRVVLTDFGIAQVEGEQQLTETGAFVGSPEYISPERVLGQRPGPESDLWSLGVVLYAAVEGMSPYRRSHTPATLQAVLSAEPQVPARGTGAFGTLVMQLLRKDPAARPPAAEVRRTLQQLASPAPAPATSPYGTVLAGGSGGSKWVPPVLHRNRVAQFALGGGALAVAVALVLLLLNPFAGDGPPEGWQVRPENEVLSADVAVPEEYKRVQEDDDGELVWYADPSGVFEIVFWHRPVKSENSSDDNPGVDPVARKAYYEKGGESTTQMEEASVTYKDATHEGRKAVEMTTEFVPYASSGDDPVRYRFRELLIPGEKESDPYWHVRVRMPAEGQAAKDGDAIFAEVTEGLKIHAS